MSYTQIFRFDTDGYAHHQADIKNAFRGAMAIWGILEEKYLPPFIPMSAKKCGITTSEECQRILGYKPTRCSSRFEREAMGDIWNLADKSEVSDVDRICLHTTFDDCLVKKDDIPKVIKAFRSFEGETSLKEQANVLEQMFADDDCIAVGWNQTSVNCDTWDNIGEYDEENNDVVPYNCLTGTEHYWLFDEIKNN